MPRLWYGFLFDSNIKDLVSSDFEEYTDIIESLQDIYGTDEITFGALDNPDDEFYLFAAVEITNDIFEDGDEKLFSMDLDQIKENDKMLLNFIDGNPELNEVAYCNSPRIFFTE